MADLGSTPLCESFLSADQLWQMEPTYPLVARVCTTCWLAQVDDVVPPETIFDDYAYFSSYSESWLAHAEEYVNAIVPRLGLTESSQVVELASNDGYLLQYFVGRGIPALGVEPAANVATDAIAKGVETRISYFTLAEATVMVSEGISADLIIGNNVLAQVPDLNDFVAGMKVLLAPSGTITMEFPHLERLIDGNQFDTIYHEHFSYFSLFTVSEIFRAHRLMVYDVDELSTHGGSLRIYATHDGLRPPGSSVADVLDREEEFGLRDAGTYEGFDLRVRETKRALVRYLLDRADEGERVVGYGAPGKANTLLNYCGIGPDLIEFTVDRNPHKWGKYMPGSRIPIHEPQTLIEARPDVVVILPWNLREEIAAQLSPIKSWGGRFAVPIPHVRELE